ncbi:mucin-17-like [Amphibalanus amphitrite]|uniref:mucin-17-like n=1 Tax=Amphibalanus amphitrite TaxID=1232801 RepID=UPI001C929BA4|nr:mucin-17-like [Amphibalanus amphitrite]
MVYARSSAAPPEGTVERRLQVLRHLADQEERSEPSPAPAPAPATVPTPAPAPASSLTPASAESPLQRSVSSTKPSEPPKSDPEPSQPPLPAKNRSPLRSLFGRDRSPKQSSSRGDPSAARPRFSMLANISALDREAAQLIEGRADQSATLPSHSHLGGALGGVDDDCGAQGDDGTLVASGKSHAEMEREKRETCQTIAMLVREKFEEKGEETETEKCSAPVSGGSPKGSALERGAAGGPASSSPEEAKQGLKTERSRVSCGASSATSGLSDKPKESAENKASNTKVQNVSSPVSLRSDSAAQKNNSVTQSPKQASPPSNVSRGKMVRQESYPADRNPFDEGPQQSGNPFEDADEPVPRSKQHGVYDNVVLAPVQSTNPFGEDEYPDTINPFADDVDAEIEPPAAAAEFAPSAPRHEDSAERCVKPNQSPAKDDKLAKTDLQPVTSSGRAKSDSPREARRGDPEPPEPAPRLSVRQGSVSAQETPRPVTVSAGGATPQRDGDIPTLVRDLNQFLDTTMQTLSSPGAQRRQAALARAEAASVPSAGWSCSRCTLINRAVLSACQACGSRRPGAPDWSAEMQRYFGGSPPQPTPRKESLGVVQGGVAHRLGTFPGQGSLGTRSLSRDSASPRRAMPARGDHRSLELGDDALNAWGGGGRPTVEKEEGSKRRTSNGPVTLAGSVFGSAGAAAKDRQEATSRRAEPKESLTAADRRSFFSDSRGSGPTQRENQPERAEPAVKKRPNLPSTFVAQLLQREASQAAPSAAPTSTESASRPSTSDEPDMDEVRRARLAFFAQRQAARGSQEQQAAAPTPSGEDSHRSSSASLSADPTDADDADDESESDSTSVSGHVPPSEWRSSDVTPAAAATTTPSTAGPATPAPPPSAPPLGTLGRAYSAAEPSLPAIKEASPSDYLEETRGAAPPPTVHEYEDVEVAPRPWKLSPAEKARRRPAGKPQWRGDSLIVPDGRGGRVRCVVERDSTAPQFVIRDGVLYSQLPTPAAVESRALPPRDAAAPAPAPASTDSAPPPEQQQEKTTTATTAATAAAGAEEEAVDPAGATCNGPTTSSAPFPTDVSTAADSGGSGGAADRPGRLESDQGCSDLMLELQRAIDCGQHREAAALARRLAALKAEKSRLASTVITVNLFVEDRKCHVGPIPLRLSPLMAVHELKTQIERDYALPVSCQRWILDSRLVEPEAEHRSLVESGVGDGSAVYLYLTVPPGAADFYRDRPISTAALFRATPPPSAPEPAPAPAPARAAAGGRQPSASGDEFHDADDGSEGASTATTTTAANKARDVKRSSVADVAPSPSKGETVENGVQTRSRLSGVPNGVDAEACVSDVTSTVGDGKQKCCDATEGPRALPMERRTDSEVPPPLPAKRRQLTGVTSPPGSLQRRTGADAQLDKERDPSSAPGGGFTQQTLARERSPPTGTVPSLPAFSPPLPTTPDPSTAVGSTHTAETGSTVEQNGLLTVRDGASPPPPLPAKQRSPSSLRRRDTVEKARNGIDQLTAGHVSSRQVSSSQVSSGQSSSGQVSSGQSSSGQSPARRVYPEPGGASLKLPGIAALVLREDGTPMNAMPTGSGARTADVTVSSMQGATAPSMAVPGTRTEGDFGDRKGPSGSRPFQMTNGVAYGDRGPVGSQNSKLAAVKTSTIQSSMKSDLSPFTTQKAITGLGDRTSAYISPISSTAYLDSNDTYSSPPTSPAPSTSSTAFATSSSPSASTFPASTPVPASRNTADSVATVMTAIVPDMHSEPMKAISMAACTAVKVTSPPATLMAPGVAEVTGQSKVASDVAVKPKAAISDVKTQSKSVEPPHGTVPQHNNCGVRETASVEGKKHAGESLAGKQSPEEASAINGMLYGSEKVLATKAESFRSSDVLQSPGLVRSVVSSVTGKVSTDASSTAKEENVATAASNAEKAGSTSPLNVAIPDKKTPVPSGKVASPVSRVPVATSRLANSFGKKAEPSTASKEVDVRPKTPFSTAKATGSPAKTTAISKTVAVTKNSSPAAKTGTDASRSPSSSSASSSGVETANAKPTTTTVQASSYSKTTTPTTKTSPQVTRTTGVSSKSSPTASRRAGAGAAAAARAVRRQSSGSVLEKVALFSCGGGTASGSGSGGGGGATSGSGKTAPSAGAVPNSNYAAHLEAMRQQLVPNAERFECPVCMLDVEPTAGVVLRECLHTFCRECLEGTVTHSDTAEVKCPYMSSEYSCQSLLLEIEIKALVSPAEYERHLARSLNHAKANASDSFHCRSPNCTGWCVFEDNVNVFNCPVCRRPNCLTCRAIHEDCDCKTYQRRLQDEAETSEDAKKTQQYLDDMVSRGDALRCPICDVILMKKWGCDWVRCSMCKNEVCWITAQPRWGPGGKGDISGGCKCGVNGKKCHPKCVYCH